MTRDPHLRFVISHGFNDINIKSIMTVLDNKPVTNAQINIRDQKNIYIYRYSSDLRIEVSKRSINIDK